MGKGRTKSLWTGRESSELVEVSLIWVGRGGRVVEERALVEPHFEEALRKEWTRFQRHKVAVILANSLSAVCIAFGGVFAAAWLEALWLTGAGLVALGACQLVFPTPTPETVDAIGIRGANRLVRGLAIATMLIGARVVTLVP